MFFFYLGVGYQLTLMKNETSNPSKIYELITGEVPDAQLKSSAGAELTYYLPKESSTKFPLLFSELEKKDLGVDNYGISVITLEEVFIRLMVTSKCQIIATSNTADIKKSALIEIIETMQLFMEFYFGKPFLY